MTNTRSVLAASCLVLLVTLSGCSSGCSKTEGDAANALTADSALVETFAAGAVAWNIAPDGRIRAEVTDKDGKPASSSATGTVEWKGESGEPASAKLTYDEGAKALVASGPAPKSDITPLRYEIAVDHGPLVGTLHVPVGGTAALVADAKSAEKVPADATGPNGGVVQVVGDDRVEVLADDASDEVRVYVLGPDGKAVAAGDRKVTLALAGDAPEVVILTPSADGLYLTGAWKAAADPSRVTVVVRRGDKARSAIVGWKPGVKLASLGGPGVKIKKHGLGWGAGGKPAELRGKEGAGVTPVVKADFKGGPDKDKAKDKTNDKEKAKDDDDDKKGKGGGDGKGRGKGGGGGNGNGKR